MEKEKSATEDEMEFGEISKKTSSIKIDANVQVKIWKQRTAS